MDWKGSPKAARTCAIRIRLNLTSEGAAFRFPPFHKAFWTNISPAMSFFDKSTSELWNFKHRDTGNSGVGYSLFPIDRPQAQGYVRVDVL